MAYLIGSLTFFRYIFVHPDAVISATDRDQLCPPIASEILPPPGTLLVRYLPHVSMEQEARGNGRGILCEVYLKAEKAERGTCVGSCRMIGLGQTHMYGAGPSVSCQQVEKVRTWRELPKYGLSWREGPLSE